MSFSHMLSIVLFSIMFCSVWTAVLQRDYISETSVGIPPRPDSVGIVDESYSYRMRRQYPTYYYPTYPAYTYPYYPYSSSGVVGNSYNMAGFYPHYNPVGSGSAWSAGGGLVGNTLSFLIG